MDLNNISISSIVIIAAIAIILAIASAASTTNQWGDLNGEWIDCMPPLSRTEDERCQYAREIGYPYIAY